MAVTEVVMVGDKQTVVGNKIVPTVGLSSTGDL